MSSVCESCCKHTGRTVEVLISENRLQGAEAILFTQLYCSSHSEMTE